MWKYLLLCLFGCGALCSAQANTRWQLQPDGSILWRVDSQRLPHYDHLEMSGEQVSVVWRYGVNADGSFSMERSVVWPMLRTIPNNTHASLMKRFLVDFPSQWQVDGQTLNNEQVQSLRLDGTLTVKSLFSVGHTRGSKDNYTLPARIELTRVYFPSADKPMVCEQYVVKNIGDGGVTLTVPQSDIVYRTDPAQGVDGTYVLTASLHSPAAFYHLEKGDSVILGATIQGCRESEKSLAVNVADELSARKRFLDEIGSKLVFHSPDSVLNAAFAFAKIRASESIFRTSGGLMHSPGGESYYAAIWANDQAEYVNPFFPFLGYGIGNESAINCYRHFARFMNDDYAPLPSSVISEGKDHFSAAGDRGDAAMVAYGASRFALELGDKEVSQQLWPLIEWCLEFCRRHLNAEGVVTSDSDELENRFPAGEANLCTSTLYYDALLSAAYLADDLGMDARKKQYRKEAEELRAHMKDYFEATVEGYETYQYYKGNDLLRAWICMPLVAGIYDRKEGTIAALLSPKLWTKDGLLTQSGTSTYWDRSLLYALRGVYAAGERQTATRYFHDYSVNRLLGEHVPYPIEAWPEGDQRHLSAESGLYCRIVTEGLFGIRPTGMHSFQLTPQLPDEWNEMELCNVYAFGTEPFSIRITRKDAQKPRLRVTIERDGKVLKQYSTSVGKTLNVKL